jgi:predicted ATPase
MTVHLKQLRLFPEIYPTRDHYPFNHNIFHQTKSILFDSPVTFFLGENGTGKSTLLEAISLKCGIHIWRDVEKTRFEYNPYEKDLYKFMAIEWKNGRVPGSFFASDIFNHFVHSLDEWAASDPGMFKYFGGKSLVTQSHGQSLMAFFRSRYQIKGLYLLDEPETALSPKSQLSFVRLLMEMAEAGHAQFIIATHSPILLACPGATLLSFDNSPVEHIDYEQTDHYQIFKAFMQNPAEYLRPK